MAPGSLPDVAPPGFDRRLFLLSRSAGSKWPVTAAMTKAVLMPEEFNYRLDSDYESPRVIAS